MTIFFFLEVLVAEAMFACFLARRKYFWLRLLAGLASVFLLQFGYDELIGHFGPPARIFSIIRYILIVVTSTFAIWFSFDCSFITALACSTGGYAVRNSIYCVTYLLYDWFGISFLRAEDLTDHVLHTLVFFALYIPFFVWIFLSRKKYRMGEGAGLSSAIVSVLIILLTIVISFYVPFETGATNYAFIYSGLCSLLVVAIQLGLFEKSSLKKEMETIRQLDHAKWEQYQLFRESMEQINIKSHDLKQQIALLLSDRGKHGGDIFDETLREIETYDTLTRTGNEALDIVLTEKNLICERNGIKCSCIVDGAALNFMSPIDIASLFGNALDNAIRGVKDEAEDKRFINVNVSRKGDLLTIHIENYFRGVIRYRDGLPVTTKPDQSRHGYGMKSIRRIVEKYHGNLLIRTDKDLFNLTVLFFENRAAA